MNLNRSPFEIGDRVVLAKDWPLIAGAGEISGEVVGFWIDGRALVKDFATGSKFVAGSDSFWQIAGNESGNQTK